MAEDNREPWEMFGSTDSNLDMREPWEMYDAPKVSQVESGLRGAAQGASLGFADEAAGGLDYLKEALGQVSKGGMLSNSDKLGSTYTAGRDESRSNYDAAQKANPGTFLLGQLAGGLAVPAGPAGLAKTAILGGAEALGSSRANNLSDLAKDTTLGTVAGGVIGGAGKLASSGFSKLGDLAGDVIEGAGGLLKKGATGLADRATNSSMGREALDKGLIKFGDKAGDIAGRVGEDASPGLVQGLGERAAREAKEGFFSDADKMALAGSVLGGPQAMMSVGTGVVGKNLAATRGAATGAVGLDKIGDILTQTPERLGKFAKPLQDAQARGALNPTVFVLQQTNPEFRELMYGKEQDN